MIKNKVDITYDIVLKVLVYACVVLNVILAIKILA
jgi:hypothetical protein